MQAGSGPGSGRGPSSSRSRSSPYRSGVRGLLSAGLVVVILVSGFAAAASFQVRVSPEELGGNAADTGFLSAWQFVGAARGTTPAPLPRIWSAAMATPTRLPRTSGDARVNAGVAGHSAAVWTFNETTALALSTEIVIEYTVDYSIGAATHTSSGTVYIESQPRALPGPLTFTVYWDSGTAGAVEINSMLEVSLVCSAIGVCP